MKSLLRFLVFSVLTVFTDSSILALPIPSFYQGMPYSEARTKMLHLGWQVPIVNYSEQCEWMEEICSKYPEVDDCSGTGMGFCNFIFTDSSGKRFIITTAGRDPLKVVAWRNE